MKKHFLKRFLAAAIFVVSMMVVSCVPDDDFVPDVDLLYGKWCYKTSFYRFDKTSRPYQLQDGTSVNVNGESWNPSEDIPEGEGQPFRWSLDLDDLTMVDVGYLGTEVPIAFTVTQLTADKMVCKDVYGITYEYTKVK